jgi:two-component system response regulator GlrR
MPSGKILVVDDDRNLLLVLKVRLEHAGYEVATATNERTAIEVTKGERFDLAVIDLQLEDIDGISLMKEIFVFAPNIPVIILTAHGTIESSVLAMQHGAYSYLTKPFNANDLLFQIEKAMENRKLAWEIRRLKDLLNEKYDFGNMVAKSEKMKGVLETVSRIASKDSTIYIHGESGTGKELIARAIHLASNRKNKPFVALNCAAIPEPLLESKLFGHKKGAFTGATQSARGSFTQAHQGTIFLDEIGDMSLTIQAKVLRVLQERQFYPVGSEELVNVDIRVIVATNKNLEEEVKKGLFRKDLFYRIHIIPIYIPPLRERKEDIQPLAEHFVKKFNKQMKMDIKGLTFEAMNKLLPYDWPGNVRELENMVEYAMNMTSVNCLTGDHILPSLPPADAEASKSLKEIIESVERNCLISYLQTSKGNVSNAAVLAGRHRTDFYTLLNKHHLNAVDFRIKEQSHA